MTAENFNRVSKGIRTNGFLLKLSETWTTNVFKIIK